MSRRVWRSSSGFLSGATACWNPGLARFSRADESSLRSSSTPKADRSCTGFFLSAILDVLPGDELRADRQLVGGDAQRLLCLLARQAFDLEKHAAGADDRGPVVRGALSLAHAGLGRVLGDRLVGEDPHPELAALLEVPADGHAAGLDLARGDPLGLQGLEAELAEGEDGAALGRALDARV